MEPITSSDPFSWYPAIPCDFSNDEATITADEIDDDFDISEDIETLTESRSLDTTESTSLSLDLISLSNEFENKTLPLRFRGLFAHKYTLSPEFIEKWSQCHLIYASIDLGLPTEPVKAILKQLFATERSKRTIKKVLFALHKDLFEAGLQARLNYTRRKAKIFIIRDAISEMGTTKACHQAIKFGGKSDTSLPGYKLKALYSQTDPSNKHSNAAYVSDLKKSVIYSKLLRSDPSSANYFMKYQMVTLRGTNRKKEKRLMAPFYAQGELLQNLYELKNTKKRLRYIAQLLHAGAAMEAAGIIHRDLKPENIFLCRNQIVIGDFGFCILKKDADNKVCGTGGYIPPFPADIPISEIQDRYAMGMIFLEIATGGRFLPAALLPTGELARLGVASEERVNAMLNSLLVRNGHKNPLIRLILGLVSISKSTRITLTEAAQKLDQINESHVHLICPALDF